jgi:hypothetical protein
VIKISFALRIFDYFILTQFELSFVYLVTISGMAFEANTFLDLSKQMETSVGILCLLLIFVFIFRAISLVSVSALKYSPVASFYKNFYLFHTINLRKEAKVLTPSLVNRLILSVRGENLLCASLISFAIST